MTISGELTYEFPEMNPRERLRELTLYIAEKLKSDRNYGRTKLAKVIYFSDIESYRRYRKPVTGSAHVHWPRGPVPEDFFDILNEMESEGLIKTERRKFHSYKQYRAVALRPANLSQFDDREVDVVDLVIQDLKHDNATSVSERSHGFAWKQTHNHERIPYEASLLSDEPLSPQEIAFGEELAREYGLEELQD